MRQSDHSPAPATGLPRRTFLLGAAVAGIAAACGGDDDTAGEPAPGADETGDETTGDEQSSADGRDVAAEFAGDSSDLDADTFIVVQRFPQNVSVPGEVRLPHSLQRNAVLLNDGPLSLGAQVVDIDGNAIGDRIMADRLDVNPAAYYTWRPMIEEPGIYSLVVDGGPAAGASFQVFAPDRVAIALAGQTLEGFETPTTAEPGDIDPICTRDPNCPFHAVTLTEALADDRATIYMIGTPAFCSTGTCTPALEALIEVSDEFADDFTFVHAEVYTDLTAQELTPAIQASKVSYEPVLFITDAAGQIIERIDTIWNEAELRQRLAAAR